LGGESGSFQDEEVGRSIWRWLDICRRWVSSGSWLKKFEGVGSSLVSSREARLAAVGIGCICGGFRVYLRSVLGVFAVGIGHTQCMRWYPTRWVEGLDMPLVS
jgi:hypothetical protein